MEDLPSYEQLRSNRLLHQCDIWGNTVNTAARMETKSEAKNKGMIDMYFVDN